MLSAFLAQRAPSRFLDAGGHSLAGEFYDDYTAYLEAVSAGEMARRWSGRSARSGRR